VTLGHFLGKSTQVLNRVPIDAPETPNQYEHITLLRKPDGTTPQILPSKNSETFGQGKNLGGTSDQWLYPNGPSGWKGGREDYETPAKIPDISQIPLSKGFSFPTGASNEAGDRYRNGTNLLSEVQDDKEPVKRFMNSFMKNNRFTDDSSFFIPDRDDDFNPTFDHPAFGKLTAGQLAHIGSILSLRATGDLKASDDGANPEDLELKAILPSFEQLGFSKVKAASLDISQIIESLPPEDISEKAFTNIVNESFGALNSVHENFSGLSSLGMSAIALVNSVTLLAAGLIAFLPDLGVSSKRNRNNPVGIALGSSQKKAKDEELSLSAFGNFIKEEVFGFVPTNSAFWRAAWKGIFVFFGADSDGALKTIIGIAKSEWFNASQISIIGRVVARSISSIYGTISQKSNWGSLSGLASIIQTLTRNKIIDILNVFATIGDAALQVESYEERLRDAQNRIAGRQLSLISPSQFSGMSLIEKRDLGWSSKASQSLLHLNAGIRQNSCAKFDQPYRKNNLRKSSDRRIPTNIKDDFEKDLDAEYVPFYFHDIRTNEIISFHAFLESLNETYTPSIDPVEAMGRVEPIKIYKGTVRKVSFTFFIVAVSIDDFEWMWLKINKLLTLVYPQYTEGRMLEAKSENKSFKFVQPFSQMMSASPMIRLRIGNVVRSNYTDWAMEDLFGANLPDTFLETETIPEYVEEGEQNKEFNPIFFDFDKDDFVELEPTVALIASIIENMYKNKENQKINKILIEGFADERGTDLYNKGLSKRRADTVERKILEFLFGYNEDIWSEVVDDYFKIFSVIGKGETNQFGSNKDEGENGWWKNRRVNVKIFWEYTESYKTKQKIAYDAAATKQKEANLAKARADRDTLIKNFMSPGGNSIVKTFKDSGAGGGLAGFIESMTFDWISTATWDVEDGKKAPKLCKVTVEFSPIHDISPGINAFGNNRAPIYRVSEENILPKSLKSEFGDSTAQVSASASGSTSAQAAPENSTSVAPSQVTTAPAPVSSATSSTGTNTPSPIVTRTVSTTSWPKDETPVKAP
jgi:outer membrane protein OmpA-like peptidoglycan-associated protein